MIGLGNLLRATCLIAVIAHCRAADLPAIDSVVNGASFLPAVSASSWVTIRGANLSATTRSWNAADIKGGVLPTSLDGVQVRINGQLAVVAYISPTQLNVLSPADPATGAVPVVVSNTAGVSVPASLNKLPLAPALFAYSAQSGRYAVAQNGSTFDLLAPALLLGSQVATRPAKPGETVTLYATGLSSASAVKLNLGGQSATVTYSGLIGPGLYQVNAVLPVLPADEYAITLDADGSTSQPALYLKMQDNLPGAFCYQFQGLSAFGDPGVVTFQMNGVPEPVVRQSGGVTTATYLLSGYPNHSASFAFRYDSWTNWQLSRIIITRSAASSGMTLHLGVTAASPDVTVMLIGPPGLFPTNALPASIPPLSAYSGTADSIATLFTTMLDFKLSPPATPLFIVRDCPAQ